MAKSYSAEIRQAGQVIRTNVTVDSFVPVTGPDAGKSKWNGVLRPPNNIGLAIGEKYVLVIPGFTHATIEITSEANPIDGSVTFEGVGKMPANASPQAVQNSQ